MVRMYIDDARDQDRAGNTKAVAITVYYCDSGKDQDVFLKPNFALKANAVLKSSIY